MIITRLCSTLLLASSLCLVSHAMEQDNYLAPGSQEYLDNQLLQLISYSKLNVIKNLLDKGANPNYHNGKTTPLHRTKNPTTCKLLREYGANPLILDHKGNTALIKAASNQNSHICKFLVEWAEEQQSKQKCISTLLLCLKQLYPQSVIYTQSDSLLHPHLESFSYRPLELLRMKNNEGKTAYDYLKLPCLNPVDQTPNQHSNN